MSASSVFAMPPSISRSVTAPMSVPSSLIDNLVSPSTPLTPPSGGPMSAERFRIDHQEQVLDPSVLSVPA